MKGKTTKPAMSAEERKYWVGFNRIFGVGPVRFQRLLDFFGDAATAWQASVAGLVAAGIETKIAERIAASRATIILDREMEHLHRCHVQVLTWADETYPRRLKEIPAPPPVLYLLGELLPGDEWAVAMVGTRQASIYGREAATRIADGLVRNGITVVSGLARGIDAVAHKTALASGGRTIAVLGCGLDQVYPAEHLKLAAEIREHGALVSDYPLGTRPEAANFPPRNRIISGLSLGVVIVEAALGSGALITADFAVEQNREVFAVPGSILSRLSEGPNRLIQQGAKLVIGVEDILDELKLEMVAEKRAVQLALPADETEATLMRYLSHEPAHVDEIGRESGLPIATVSATLTLMELKGIVRQVGGMHYVLRESAATYDASPTNASVTT